MKYDLTKASDIEKFKARVQYVLAKGKVVTLAENTQKQVTGVESIRRKQMNLAHLWFSVFADYTGEIDKEMVKRNVKRVILGMKMTYNKFSKREEPVDYHLSEMSVQDASQFMEKFKMWALSEYGCYLPYENEVGYEEMVSQYRNR